MDTTIDYTTLPYRNATATPWEEAIDVELEHPEYGWIPYTATAYDEDPRCVALYNKLNAERPALLPSPITLEEVMASDIRAQRDAKLKATDWTQLPDIPEATKELWSDYRQALRDVPAQPGFPMSIEWPVPPTQANTQTEGGN